GLRRSPAMGDSSANARMTCERLLRTSPAAVPAAGRTHSTDFGQKSKAETALLVLSISLDNQDGYVVGGTGPKGISDQPLHRRANVALFQPSSNLFFC